MEYQENICRVDYKYRQSLIIAPKGTSWKESVAPIADATSCMTSTEKPLYPPGALALRTTNGSLSTSATFKVYLYTIGL